MILGANKWIVMCFLMFVASNAISQTGGVEDVVDSERAALDIESKDNKFNSFGFESSLGAANLTNGPTENPLQYGFSFVSGYGNHMRFGLGLQSLPARRNLLNEWVRTYELFLEAQRVFGFLEKPFGFEARLRLGSRGHSHSSSLAIGAGGIFTLDLGSGISLLLPLDFAWAGQSVGGWSSSAGVGLRFLNNF